MTNVIRLFRKNSMGIGTWSIWYEDDQLYYSHSTVEGGAEIVHVDTIVTNQSGRTLQQQIELEMNSRMRRAMDRGYKMTREEAVKGDTNQLDLPNPMLAQRIDQVPPSSILFKDAYVQPKLDGHRCLITRSDGKLIAYTRRGKEVNTISHILTGMEWLDEGQILDGELYVHGPKLQDIGSWIKRQQEGSYGLQFCWYDTIEKMPFNRRFEKMQELYQRHSPPNVVLVETLLAGGMDDVWHMFQKYRERGYEGAMLRLSIKEYEPNRRARQLLKVKERHDCEVTVMGGQPARDGSAILHVRTDWGTEFDILAPGSIDEKRRVMDDIASYIGRNLTIEYAHMTSDKIPFHAVAIRWREDV